MHKNITIVIIDCVEPQKAAQVLAYSNALFPVERSLLLTHQVIPIENKNIEIGIISKLCSVDEYSQFVLRELYKYIETSHCLLIQTDGFICNPQSWTDSFLDYDFIGAPLTDFAVWHSFLPEDYKGLLHTSSFNEQRWPMNGGFSLRSKSLLSLSAQCPIQSEGMAEDNYITVFNRKWFEEQAMVFASKNLAFAFSHENPLQEQAFHFNTCFGFHGKISPKHIELAYRPFEPKPNALKKLLGLQQNVSIVNSIRILLKRLLSVPYTLDDFKTISKLKKRKEEMAASESVELYVLCNDGDIVKLKQTIASAVKNIRNTIVSITIFSDSAEVSAFSEQQSFHCNNESILTFLQKPIVNNVILIESGTMIIKALQYNIGSRAIYFTFDKPCSLTIEMKALFHIKYELPVCCTTGFYFLNSESFALFQVKINDFQFDSLESLYSSYIHFQILTYNFRCSFEFFKMEHRKWLGDATFWELLYEPSDMRVIQFKN